MGIDGVAWVDDTVAVAAIGGIVENGQGQKAIRRVAWRLWRNITKELSPVVDEAISVAIQGEPTVCIGSIRPA